VVILPEGYLPSEATAPRLRFLGAWQLANVPVSCVTGSGSGSACVSRLSSMSTVLVDSIEDNELSPNNQPDSARP
jgi:hypothetical protein